jgi:glycosyltransferase involved in cell wall biosynthesis
MENHAASEPPRLLLVWNHAPCKITGAGIILWRLFQAYPAEKLWLLTSSVIARHLAPFNPVPPPGRQRTVFQIFFPHRYVDRLAEIMNALLLPVMVWRGIRLAREKEIEALFTVPWNTFFVAAYFIHRFTRLPLHIYMMDDPAGAPSYPAWKKVFYALLMPRIMKAASRVWCVSRYMAENLRQRYGVDARALLPLLDVDEFVEKARTEQVSRKDEARVVYTGAIYDAQLDALRNLVNALNGAGPGTQAIRLYLYTSQPEPLLQKMKLAGPNVHRAFVPIAEMPRVLGEADVLFLPLSFDEKMQHVVETSLPTKLAEYLASGVPILVHAPPHSTVARYCRENGCGAVVDQLDPQALLAALRRLLDDRELRKAITERARVAAYENHDLGRNLPRFLQDLSTGSR